MSNTRKVIFRRNSARSEKAMSLRCKPDSPNSDVWHRPLKLEPEAFKDLDLAIQNGWGDTPQTELPPDWRTRKKEALSTEEIRIRKTEWARNSRKKQ